MSDRHHALHLCGQTFPLLDGSQQMIQGLGPLEKQEVHVITGESLIHAFL